jgi:hypothetical protein
MQTLMTMVSWPPSAVRFGYRPEVTTPDDLCNILPVLYAKNDDPDSSVDRMY